MLNLPQMPYCLVSTLQIMHLKDWSIIGHVRGRKIMFDGGFQFQAILSSAIPSGC